MPNKKPVEQQKTEQEQSIHKAEKSIHIDKVSQPATMEDISSFNINKWIHNKEEKKEEQVKPTEDLPTDHFSEVDVLSEWSLYLDSIHDKDTIRYSALKGCMLQKEGESNIIIKIPSQAAKSEFEHIRKDFLGKLKVKVNNFKITSSYIEDKSLQKEIITKRKIFDKFAEKNPILRELDDLMKFDFS